MVIDTRRGRELCPEGVDLSTAAAPKTLAEKAITDSQYTLQSLIMIGM